VEPLIHRISAWDGLTLHVREWRGGDRRSPIVCLPGVVRSSGDFEVLAPAIAADRRVIAIDYAGRGASGRSADIRRYATEACVRDVMDVCAALHLYRVVVIGTSFGGLLAMGLAATRPGLIRAVVLNDIGPGVAAEGTAFVRDFVGFDPALRTLDECVGFLRGKLPTLSLDTEAAWRRMAELTYQPGPDRRYHPLWDIRIAGLLTGPIPNLWPLWGGLAHYPVLLIRGEASNILLPATVARMKLERRDMRIVALPGVGHAPTLAEPAALSAIRGFLEEHDQDPNG
jgi:pimeloyl-ACP methyl ester carboxylesterase